MLAGAPNRCKRRPRSFWLFHILDCNGRRVHQSARCSGYGHCQELFIHESQSSPRPILEWKEARVSKSLLGVYSIQVVNVAMQHNIDDLGRSHHQPRRCHGDQPLG